MLPVAMAQSFYDDNAIRWLVRRWNKCNMLRTSSFMDDAIFHIMGQTDKGHWHIIRHDLQGGARA